MVKILALSLVSAIAAAGCIDGVECADGTFEVDGECRPGASPRPPSCGPGTHFDHEIAMCVPDLPPTRCDEASTDVEVDGDGVRVCKGAPIEGCVPIVCPSPRPGNVSICGQLLDLETRDPIRVPGASSARCPAEPTEDGPCSLQLAFYDALDFASNPNPQRLAADEVSINDCGQYRGVDVELPFNKTIGIAVDDASGTADRHTLTGVALIAQSGRQHTGVTGYATRHTTDATWTETGMPPFAPTTFAEYGVYVALFMHAGEPVEGVTVTAGGTERPGSDYYFSDPDDDLTTIDPSLDATGPNGAALLVGSSLGDHGGTGGEVDGCTWEPALATAIPGVVFVQEKQLVDALDEPCE